jgi:hypothetical protein
MNTTTTIIHSERVEVNREALAQLLRDVDPGGFMSNSLGVRFVDDGSGIARQLLSDFEAEAYAAQREFKGDNRADRAVVEL